MEGSGGGSLPNSAVAAADPAVVEKLVEELKSQGVFDQFRKECLAEVDTKPAFQNLRSRVEGSVNRFLSKQTSGWKPSQNKNHLRNLLRKHIQESSYLESGMDRIVDQVVNPKILSVIEPQVEGVICNFLGVAKPPEDDPPPPEDPVANGHISDVEMGEKLSNISSEDIEMRSAEDHTSTKGDEGPARTSPPRTPQIPGGHISPLTPPLPPSPGSPHTPPLPPSHTRPNASATPTEVVVEEGIALDDQHAMSPVSDTDFDNVSPPKDSPITPSESSLPSPPGEESQPLPLPPQAPAPPPPPPPPPPETPPLPPGGPVGRPPSPLTSPIGSSSDEMDANVSPVNREESTPDRPPAPRGGSACSGPSDISDTDLPASNSNSENEKDMSEADLNALEKARAELQAKLAAASIEEDSEGEIRTDDDSEGTNKSYVEKFNEIMSSDASVPPTPDQSGSTKVPNPADVVSPISDSMSPLAMSKTSEEVKSSSSESDDDKKPDGDGGVQDKKNKDGHNSDDDRSGDSGGASANPNPESQSNPPEEKEKESKSPKSDETKKERRSSSTSSSHDHHSKSHHHHRSSSSKKDEEEKKRKSGHSHSHHHKTSKNRPDDKHRRKSTDDRKAKEAKDTKDSKEKKKMDKERIEKEKIKLQAIEKKIKEKDKFSDFDMFAPKPPKPKAVLSRPPSSASSKGSASPLAFGAKSPLAFGSKTPPAFGSKTPPTFGSKTPPTFGSKTPPVFGHKSQPPKPNGPHNVANGLKTSKPMTTPSAAVITPDIEKTRKLKVEKEATPKVERKVFPELPLPKTNGDKLKQHEVDILEAKQRLEEARQKRLVEIKKLELEKKQKKRSMSSSMSDGSPNSSAQNHKPRSEAKKTKVKEKPTVVPKERKKLTLSDLSDEDEVSDWSDAEAPSSVRNASKRKRKAVLADSSEDDDDDKADATGQSDKGPKRQTRTLALKAKADSILNSDPETKVFQGFNEEPKSDDSKDGHGRVLAEYLEDEDNISLDEVDLDELDDLPDEILTLEDLEDPEATCNLLKSFGGHPTLVQGPPQWLKTVLSAWNLTRSDVNLFYQRPTKILSQVKPISEYAYNRTRLPKSPRKSPPVESWSTKPEPVLPEEPDFFGFESSTSEINESNQKLLFRLAPDSAIDENGNTFGMKSEDFLDLAQLEEDNDHADSGFVAQLNVNIEDHLLRELRILADQDPGNALGAPPMATDSPSSTVNGTTEDLDEGGCSPQSSGSSKENQEDQGVRRVSKRAVKTDFGPSTTTLSKRPRRSGKVQLAQM